MLRMNADLTSFLSRNRRLVSLFVAVYLLLAGSVIAISLASETLLAGSPEFELTDPAAVEYAASHPFIFWMSFVPGLASFAMLSSALIFYRSVIDSWTPVRTRFLSIVWTTFRAYAGRFFKAVLIFFPIGFALALAYMLIFSPDIQAFGTASSDLMPFYSALIVVFMALFAAVSFDIIFVPLVACSTTSLTHREMLAAGKSLIKFNPQTIRRLFIAYQSIVISATIASSLITSSKSAALLSALLAVVEIAWSVVLAWQFMSINLKRKAEGQAPAGTVDAVLIQDSTGSVSASDAAAGAAEHSGSSSD